MPKLLQTVDDIRYELIPATEKVEIEKTAHKIKEVVQYINKISEYSECAGACIVIQKIKKMIGGIYG